MVLRTAYRLLGNLEDAQDAAQEVLLRMFRHCDNIGAEPRAWIYRVTVNVCNDHYRRSRPVPVERIGEAADPAPDPERQLTLKQRMRLVTEGMRHLAPRERACLVLRDIEGLSTDEVAKVLEVEEGTVRSQIHSARVKLAAYVRRAK
jgi:RNA polymerase sigma-70 factor (ECF subfamily)